MMLRRLTALHMLVHEFNTRFKRGDRVLYRPSPTAPGIEDKVFCEAEVLHGQAAVAWLAGQRHPVSVRNVFPLEEPSHA